MCRKCSNVLKVLKLIDVIRSANAIQSVLSFISIDKLFNIHTEILGKVFFYIIYLHSNNTKLKRK